MAAVSWHHRGNAGEKRRCGGAGGDIAAWRERRRRQARLSGINQR